MANNAQEPSEDPTIAADVFLKEIKQDLEEKRKARSEDEQLKGGKSGGEASMAKKTKDSSGPVSGNAAMSKRTNKRENGLAINANNSHKCLTCEGSNHHWRDCRQSCAHHQQQGKTTYHNGKQCPLKLSIYEQAGKMAQSRAQFDESRKRAKLVSEAKMAKTKAEFTLTVQENNRAIYEQGFKDGEDRAWEIFHQVLARRDHEAINRRTPGQRDPASPPPQQQQSKYPDYAPQWGSHSQHQVPPASPYNHEYLPRQLYGYDAPQYPPLYSQQPPQQYPAQYPERRPQQYPAPPASQWTTPFFPAQPPLHRRSRSPDFGPH
ncbi:hypothetical protein H2201_006677 [Coniosporium apollinis]|uniref:CCHC-type domain-containing protein n=2 Tax=Coniosporium TaxID=2810619 RepID=A0ABQ9NT15_9PEZI|nr:hypothetical protein H2199_003859 [Cladosporium sp. JES 115]KAJ9661126.1 hypothetical protein H2201_006677 [Coniosporium apollinis]